MAGTAQERPHHLPGAPSQHRQSSVPTLSRSEFLAPPPTHLSPPVLSQLVSAASSCAVLAGLGAAERLGEGAPGLRLPLLSETLRGASTSECTRRPCLSRPPRGPGSAEQGGAGGRKASQTGGSCPADTPALFSPEVILVLYYKLPSPEPYAVRVSLTNVAVRLGCAHQTACLFLLRPLLDAISQALQ